MGFDIGLLGLAHVKVSLSHSHTFDHPPLLSSAINVETSSQYNRTVCLKHDMEVVHAYRTHDLVIITSRSTQSMITIDKGRTNQYSIAI